MASVVFSNAVAYRLFARSLFDQQLKARGFDLTDGHDQLLLSLIKLSILSQSATSVVSDTTSLYETRQLLIKNNNTIAYVIDQHQQYIGAIDINHILKLEDSMDIRVERVSHYLMENVLKLSTDLSVWEAMNQIGNFEEESLPIIDSESKNYRVSSLRLI